MATVKCIILLRTHNPPTYQPDNTISTVKSVILLGVYLKHARPKRSGASSAHTEGPDTDSRAASDD